MADQSADLSADQSTAENSKAGDHNPKPARFLGLPDEAFQQRKPLRGQITKREVRAVSLYSLALRHDSVVWDVGAGTGSIAVEAAFIAHEGRVYAVERDDASLELLRRNVEKWGSPNLLVVPGEAPEAFNGLADPDSVFIGGSGGRLAEILSVSAERLRPGGRMVVNLAALERTTEARQTLNDLGFATELTQVSAARGKEMPDGTMRLESLNPVFVLSAWRRESPHGR